jgi:DNA-binding PadR family transcriptional regulator
VAKYKAGKGKNYQDYGMETLRVMYEAGIIKFTVADFSQWSGLPATGSAKQLLDNLVKRGWLAVEPQELRDGKPKTVYNLASAVWFGSGVAKK